jgi:transposase
MWTDADRNTYRQAGDRLPSDLTDPERERLEPLVPQAKPWGRPRKTDMRSAMNAITFSPTNRLPVAVFAARGLPAALDGNRRACGPSFDRFAAARNALASKSPRSLIAAPIAN